jgi:hypothetical protein
VTVTTLGDGDMAERDSRPEEGRDLEYGRSDPAMLVKFVLPAGSPNLNIYAVCADPA